MPLIYCNINIFDYDQSIYVLDSDNGGASHLIARVPFQHLGTAMPELCYTNNIYTVRLNCSIPGMAQQAADAIYAGAAKKYGNNHKIDIEVL